MSSGDEHWQATGGDDVLAAEYVLGVLDAEERRSVEARRETDQAFARRIDHWEAYFSPLADAIDDAAPSPSVKTALDAALFPQPSETVVRAGRAAGAVQSAPGLLARLGFWQATTFAALGLAVALAVLPALDLITPPSSSAPSARLAASLTSAETSVRYVAVYDADTKKIGLRRLEGVADANRDFELWVIPDGEQPISLGIVPKAGAIAIDPSEAIARKITSGAVFAITLEQQGGSPDGTPQGPVVAAGDLGRI